MAVAAPITGAESRPTPEPLANAICWAVPLVVCVLVFWRALPSWFQQDDFSWLRVDVHSFADFWQLLTEPRAEGTIRPLSERFFFVVFRRLFGLNAFPFHLFVFLTQFANLALLTALVRRLTGSAISAAIASTVWAANIGLLAPMMWTSAYNQIQCSFFYLISLWLFLRHVETGRWSFYFWQCGTFLLGFGAHEAMVMYPLALLAYCALLERRQARKALPLMIPSAFFAAAHLWLIPRPSGPYALHIDKGMLWLLKDYWSWALGPPHLMLTLHLPGRMSTALWVSMTLALAAALLKASDHERRLGVFGLAWFVITLAPVLPLRDHRVEYYLTVPAIGLALAVGAAACYALCALSSVPSHVPLTDPPDPEVLILSRDREGAVVKTNPGRHTSGAPRWAIAIWLLVYLACSIGFLEQGTRAHYRRSLLAKRFITGLRQVRALHPKKGILLTGVSDLLFYAAMYDQGPLTAGLPDVHLAPNSEGIAPRPGLGPVDDFRLPARPTLDALQHGDLVVYDVSRNNFKNITSLYTLNAPQMLKPAAPRRVDVGDRLMSAQIGEGWHDLQTDHRWMGRRAEVRLAGPRSGSEKLRIRAIYPEHFELGNVQVAVSVNGIPVGRGVVHDPRSVEHTFPLPQSVVGLDEITVTLETDHTFRAPGDERDLSLAFGVVELVN